jgi:hypothetical protein
LAVVDLDFDINANSKYNTDPSFKSLQPSMFSNLFIFALVSDHHIVFLPGTFVHIQLDDVTHHLVKHLKLRHPIATDITFMYRPTKTSRYDINYSYLTRHYYYDFVDRHGARQRNAAKTLRSLCITIEGTHKVSLKSKIFYNNISMAFYEHHGNIFFNHVAHLLLP